MHSFGQQTLHVTFSNSRTEIQHSVLLDFYSLQRQDLSWNVHDWTHCCLISIHVNKCCLCFFLCLLYSWKWHCYCTKKNHFNSFKKRVKTLAFICKALYLGLCCLHVLYRWFHFYIRPHFSPPNGKLGFRFCSDIEFIELSFEASAPLDSPVTVRNVFKRFIYLLCVRQMSPHHHCGPTYSTSPHSSEHFS